ncbi:hydrolase activity protein [[Candida] boidinii]|nr:hydrolase activity protein [[Candida] boidinii]
MVLILKLRQQGAGLVNAYNLIHYNTTVLSAPYLELNDTVNRVSDFEIELYNGNSVDVTYEINHIAGTTISSRDEDWYPHTLFPPYDQSSASVTLSENSITIPAGATKKISVNIQTPSQATLEGPIYEGKIQFNGDNGEIIAIPYMGIDVDTHAWNPLIDIPLILYYNQTDGYYYPLSYFETNNITLPSSPTVMYTLRFGTEYYSIDLVSEDYDVDADFAFPESSEHFIGSVRTTPDVYNNITPFPLEFAVRFSALSGITFDSFNDSSSIPAGTYKILTRFLLPFGDRQNPDDWFRNVSPAFNFAGTEDEDTDPSSSLITSSSSSASSESVASSSVASSVASSSVASSSVASSSVASSSVASSFASLSVSLSSTAASSSAAASSSISSPTASATVPELSKMVPLSSKSSPLNLLVNGLTFL